MSELQVTKIRMRDGAWEGTVKGAGKGAGTPGARPDIGVRYLDRPVAGIELHEDREAGHWTLRIPIPPEAIGDGVQTFVIHDANNEKLADFTLIAGEAVADDLRTEVELLRAELDMLKRAFRRHCLETM
jgi:hypothetical protein